MTKVLGRSAHRRKCQVIELRLMQASDMFERPHADLFSEYRNFLTGVDFCISEAARPPVPATGQAAFGCRLRRSTTG